MSIDRLKPDALPGCMFPARIIWGFLAAVLLVADMSQMALAVQPQSMGRRMDTRHEVSLEFVAFQDAHMRSNSPGLLDYSYTHYRTLPVLKDVTLGAGVRGRTIGMFTEEDMVSQEKDLFPSANWLYVTGSYLTTTHQNQFVTSQIVASYERKPEHDEYDGSMDRYRGGLIMARPLGALQATGNWIITSSGPHLWRMLSIDLSIGSESVVIGARYEHHGREGVEQTYLRREAYVDFLTRRAKGMSLAVGSYRLGRQDEIRGVGWQFFRIAVTL